MANEPPYQDCSRSQATVASPSSCSSPRGSSEPPDPKPPLQLWMTTWKPCRAKPRP